MLHGLQGPVTVNGRQFNSSGMPPWKDTLTDEEIAEIEADIRGSRNTERPAQEEKR